MRSPATPLRSPIASARSRLFSTRTPLRRNLSPRPEQHTPLSPNIPQIDYVGETREVLSFTGRVVKILLLTGVSIVAVGVAGYEGLHLYVENGPMAVPSRGDDEWGWEDEVQGWTGGPKGGTDPRLGIKGRHAVRAAWMCQSWGAGDANGAIGRQGFFEPDYMAVRGMIGEDPTVIRPDRGYEMAGEFINVALEAARMKGLVFPPTLSVLRENGPPTTVSSTVQGDSAVVDLLLLKAGALERVGSMESLNQAKELYEQIVTSIHSDSSPIYEARIMRLATKVGTLCARMGQGDEALAWWGWGLQRVGMEIPSRVDEIKTEARAWFGKAPEPQQPTQPTIPTSLPPPVLRATVSLLISASTHLATRSHVPAAAKLQTTALTLLPAPTPIQRPTSSTAGATLHHTWLEQRSSLLTLHLASTTYALGRPGLNLATVASNRADNVLAALTPLAPVYAKAYHQAAHNLRRDALLTAAEAAYTRAILLERQPAPPLDTVAELFERAMFLNAMETGKTDTGAMGAEWQKYYQSFSRVKEKLGQSVETKSKLD